MSAAIPTLLTAAELSQRWRIPQKTVYHLSRTGQIPLVRLGKQYRYSLRAIETFELEGGTERKAA